MNEGVRRRGRRKEKGGGQETQDGPDPWRAASPKRLADGYNGANRMYSPLRRSQSRRAGTWD